MAPRCIGAPDGQAQPACYAVQSVACSSFLTVADIRCSPRRIGAIRGGEAQGQHSGPAALQRRGLFPRRSRTQFGPTRRASTASRKSVELHIRSALVTTHVNGRLPLATSCALSAANSQHPHRSPRQDCSLVKVATGEGRAGGRDNSPNPGGTPVLSDWRSAAPTPYTRNKCSRCS